MKIRTLASMIMLTCLFASAKVTLPSSPLTYQACYHCGFVKISAGDALITLNLDDDRLTATLNGQSVPIGHRTYAISDTLIASMIETDGMPKEIVTYENGWYSKPRHYHAPIIFNNPANYRNIHGEGDLDASSGTMEAVTISTDMLALFYYFRTIDFENLTEGQKINIAIDLPDGDVQQLVIDFEGKDNFNGHDSYKLTFNYSYHGSMSNYPVTAQIDTQSRLPLQLSADIKIGHIELILKA